MLFGAGPRRKLLYQHGVLRDALAGEVLKRWSVAAERLDFAAPAVTLELAGSGTVALWEDEAGVWLEESGQRQPLATAPVRLPDFAGHPHAALLRRLHHDMLVNLVPTGPAATLAPVPNLLVYHQPWYRDAAMVAMCLARTGNLDLLAAWVRGLREPFDRNNAGHCEPDNLGQALYLIALLCGPVPPGSHPDGAAHHPLIPALLQAAECCREGDHLTGLSDFGPHPVYQTKWLKFGLRALALPDSWQIPAVADGYSALFWMDYRDQHVPTVSFSPETGDRYPYLTWAEAHFAALSAASRAGAGASPLPLSGAQRGRGAGVRTPCPSPLPLPCPSSWPLTWEAHASQAAYEGMTPLGAEYLTHRLCTPHTWHAAELFLYLLDQPAPHALVEAAPAPDSR
jgi:hypothetical protein